MMEKHDYYRNGDKNRNYGNIIKWAEGFYTASVAVESKDYKTLKGAQKFMAKYNYKETSRMQY